MKVKALTTRGGNTAPRHKGFTLIEVLVVIAIMGILGGLAWSATGLVRNRSMRKEAESHVALISASMTAYMADNGGVMPYARGDEWSSHILYRILSGDLNNDGLQDKDKNGSFVTAYCDTLVVNSDPKEKQIGLPAYKVKLQASPDMPEKLKTDTSKRYAIIDPWGVPYRYCLGCEADSDNGQPGYGINADFDIYSLGPDGLGNGKTNSGDNLDNISNITTWR